MTSKEIQATPIAPELLIAKIQELETKIQAQPSKPKGEPRTICSRNHTTDHWKVTPKGVRYCTACYKELRLAQAEKQLKNLGRI